MTLAFDAGAYHQLALGVTHQQMANQFSLLGRGTPYYFIVAAHTQLHLLSTCHYVHRVQAIEFSQVQ